MRTFLRMADDKPFHTVECEDIKFCDRVTGGSFKTAFEDPKAAFLCHRPIGPTMLLICNYCSVRWVASYVLFAGRRAPAGWSSCIESDEGWRLFMGQYERLQYMTGPTLLPGGTPSSSTNQLPGPGGPLPSGETLTARPSVRPAVS